MLTGHRIATASPPWVALARVHLLAAAIAGTVSSNGDIVARAMALPT